MKKDKDFDCVEMMHQGAERIRKETAGMSIEEQVAYWRRRTQELLDRRAERQKLRKAS
jgi:hypothetical protein